MTNALIAALSFLAVLLASGTSHAEIFFPTQAEQLPKPVVLSDCKGIAIIEWKASSYSSLTKATSTVFSKMNQRCKVAKAAFIKFAKEKYNYEVGARLDVVPFKVSVLPANQHSDGLIDRNLNDPARFRDIKHGLDWGYTNYTVAYVLLRNDPLMKINGNIIENKYFYRTWAHELAHVFVHCSKLKDYKGWYKREDDEAVAQEFTAYLGFSSEIESARDTLSKEQD